VRGLRTPPACRRTQLRVARGSHPPDPRPVAASASASVLQSPAVGNTAREGFQGEGELCRTLCQCVGYHEAHGSGAGESNAERAKGEDFVVEMKRQEAFPIFSSKATDKLQIANAAKLSFFVFNFFPSFCPRLGSTVPHHSGGHPSCSRCGSEMPDTQFWQTSAGESSACPSAQPQHPFPGRAPSGVLCPVLGSPVQER